MEQYNPVTPEVVKALQAAVGEKYVKTDPDVLAVYQSDESLAPSFWTLPEVVVSAGNTEDVASVMQIANTYHVPVTPRSAGTSVSCGAVPAYHGIVLLMERMNHIIELNEEGMYMTVEAGVRTIDIQNAAKAKGLLYAGDPCSSDSCLIGGNLATNAGGNKAVRYGTTRHQVYSIEVVLPSGKVARLGATLKKCSTGFCLDQLIIGSEGTLGIITKATLKLVPLPPYKLDVLAVFTDLAKATALVPKLVKAGLNPTSVEFMDNNFVRSASDYSELRLPHYEDGCYDIVSIETFNEDELDDKMEKLAAICEECGATDVVEADDRVWKIRRNCLESTRVFSKVATSEDLVVPVTKIADCIQHLVRESQKYDFRVFCLAHAGDGNLHFQILQCDMNDEDWERELQQFRAVAYKYVYNLGGRLSGEHGIGLKRLEYMEQYTNPVELELMKTIKRAVDPNWILNPGKVISAD
ncbi:MAG: FAD-binding oxidoreductase [Megasphaera sp.]|jgi:glycolate oxidase|nr:FAD-binding oxidoreductase [Megasphaera sp.]MCI1247640.1 FAD-binding oxidoreductase [Megasphaera sp.]